MKITSDEKPIFTPLVITVTLESLAEIQALHAFFGNTGRPNYEEVMKPSRHFKTGGDAIMAQFGQQMYDKTHEGSAY